MAEKAESRFQLHEAARDGRMALVESLLQANSKLATQRDEDDRQAIHWAISYNHRAIIDLLVARKDFDPDVQDASGWTCLMIAASLKNGDESVDLLLAKGADVTLQNNNGQTALHMTTSKANLNIARILLTHGASARIKDRRGQLALHRAAAIGSVPLIELLLAHKSPINTTDNSSSSALHHAISEGHGEAAMALLRAGAESNNRDAEGLLPIQTAPDAAVRNYILRQAEREELEIATPATVKAAA